MKGLLLLKGQDNDTNFLSTLPRAKRHEIREAVVDLILATDMSAHFTLLSAFKAKVLPKIQGRHAYMAQVLEPARPGRMSRVSWVVEAVKNSVYKNSERHLRRSRSSKMEGLNAFSLSPQETRLLLKLALKCADIGHVTVAHDMHTLWVRSLQEEFYRQGDCERTAKIPISFLCDGQGPAEEFYRQGDCERTAKIPISFLCDRARPRNGPAFGENQLGFLDFICSPMYTAWVECFPTMEELLSNLQRNRRIWEVDAMKNGKNIFEEGLQKQESSMGVTKESFKISDRLSKSW
eukprot:CAMPEP_0196598620 /NCGR_PEP_ID=MMETSP1081-20130531/94420_1 /TAXON_ID=36882 /ORGANISM="Pyramimonas amylifera, Strain CCMP720" /LENGTH=291 /DNA_ID=CAMNT_0041924333 /DNA_START=46 /DNA_END=919 /DNA_ORIENTATION=+